MIFAVRLDDMRRRFQILRPTRKRIPHVRTTLPGWNETMNWVNQELEAAEKNLDERKRKLGLAGFGAPK